jgi:N-dimethylarginine dimethylaminohydrolase
MSDLYLMSPPGPRWALRGRANFRSRDAAPVDAARARREWLAVALAIEELGGTVVALVCDDDALTGLPYAAEAGHVLPPKRGTTRPRFLLPRMRAPHRQRERELWAPLAAQLGFEVLDPGAGVWEGQGDVATFDGVSLWFFGGRTDREGMESARRQAEGESLVLEIREPAFHGNMALLPLSAADRLLVCRDVFVSDSAERLERRFGKQRIIDVSEQEIRHYATNGLPVGDGWIAPSVAPGRVRQLVESLGLRVRLLPMRELCEKAGGASRCLVCHAPDLAGPLRIPEQHRLSSVARQLEADHA